MHRTQISLEEQQYHNLRQYARQRKLSISAIIRELLEQHVPATAPDNEDISPLKQLKGIVSGKGKTTGKNHNDVLYAHEIRWNDKP